MPDIWTGNAADGSAPAAPVRASAVAVAQNPQVNAQALATGGYPISAAALVEAQAGEVDAPATAAGVLPLFPAVANPVVGNPDASSQQPAGAGFGPGNLGWPVVVPIAPQNPAGD